MVDLVECPLLLRSLQDGLEIRGCVGEGSCCPKCSLTGALAHLGLASDLSGIVGTGEGREMVRGELQRRSRLKGTSWKVADTPRMGG